MNSIITYETIHIYKILWKIATNLAFVITLLFLRIWYIWSSNACSNFLILSLDPFAPSHIPLFLFESLNIVGHELNKNRTRGEQGRPLFIHSLGTEDTERKSSLTVAWVFCLKQVSRYLILNLWIKQFLNGMYNTDYRCIIALGIMHVFYIRTHDNEKV